MKTNILLVTIVIVLFLHNTAHTKEHHHHGMDTHMGHEQHAAIHMLIDDNEITHTAINSGSWFNATTWQNGIIPGNDAEVLIPENISVHYDQISENSIRNIKVRGTLQFSSSQSSKLRVDLLLIESSGNLIIGSKANPIKSNVSAVINIVDHGDLDIINDTQLLGRGIIAMGPVTMHGENKTTHLKTSTDPQQGDTQITLAHTPANWHIGDTIIIAGTRYSGWKWDNSIQSVRYHGTQDEVRTITNINQNIVSFDEPLQYNHSTPRHDLKTSVANFSRNITIATENPETTAKHHRGHVMFMHHANVDVRYTAFWHLGRTDKSIPSSEAADIENIQANSNVRGRYPFHFHRAGVDDPRNPGIAIGNAVYNSPGWGYVHHDSNAVFDNNVSYETFGAGFVAETGNEIGSWTNNLAIKAEGNSAFNPKNGNDRENFDMGRTGDGFWFQGRMVRSVNNIAASVNHGFVYLHRGSGMLNFPGNLFMLPEALRLDQDSTPDDAPILSFHGNESFASTVGLYVVKANPNQQHDIHSHFKDFKAWEVRAGAAMEYTSHYLLENFDIIAKTPEQFSNPYFGIEFGTNTTDMVINGASIEGMAVGVHLSKDFTSPTPPEANQYVLVDVMFDNVTQNYEDYDPNLDLIIQKQDLVIGRFEINIDNSSPLQYNSPSTTAGSGIFYTGTKTDHIGDSPIPAGTDQIGVPHYDMRTICTQDGYYRTADNTPYIIVEEYFTERTTGVIHKLGLKTRLGQAVDDAINNQFTAWGSCFQAGTLDLNSQSPNAVNDIAHTAYETEITINLLENDSDPDEDELSVDGIVQPINGTVFDNGNGTVLYRPDFSFTGTDTFSYWASDHQGNFTPAHVTVHVSSQNDVIFINGFE